MIPIGAIAEHMRACYPSEGAGLLIADAAGALRFVPIENIAGRADALETSRRTVRDGYVMDPKSLLAALDEAERGGGRLYAIVHSHPDVGAYFSKEDKAKALDDDGELLWPGVLYLVVSVRSGTVDDARLYTWDAGKCDFLEQQISIIN